MTDQIFYKKPYAKIYQTDKANCMDKAIRIYRDSPYTITLQVRSHTDKRGQIATATITRKEALEIADYLTRKAAELQDEVSDNKVEPSESELRQSVHYTAGFYNFPYVGKTNEDKDAYKLGRDEAGSNILGGI